METQSQSESNECMTQQQKLEKRRLHVDLLGDDEDDDSDGDLVAADAPIDDVAQVSDIGNDICADSKNGSATMHAPVGGSAASAFVAVGVSTGFSSAGGESSSIQRLLHEDAETNGNGSGDNDVKMHTTNTSTVSTSSSISSSNAKASAYSHKDSTAPWPGWEILRYPRVSDSDIVDKEYISPLLKLRFRSRKAAVEFFSIINEEEGSEERAWDRYRNLKGKSISSFAIVAPKDSPAKAPVSKPTGGVKIDLARDDKDNNDNEVADEEEYWEVDKILGKRKRCGLVEFLVKWKDCPEGADTSWEPRLNLSDTALQEANQFGKPQKEISRQKRRVALKPESETSAHFVESPFTSAPVENVVNGGIVDTIVMRGIDVAAKEENFLSLWAKNRVLNVQYDLAGDLTSFKPQKDFVNSDGVSYGLVTSKMYATSHGFYSGRHQKKRHAILSYVATSGRPGLQPWVLQDELDKIADFGALTPSKAAARLQLFQTPGKQEHIWNLRHTTFEMIDERAHEGCGFMPPFFFDTLLGIGARAKRVDSIQVRIFGPRIGIGKGMIFKKIGISKIQLPPSFMKVGPSRTNNEGWVVMIAKGTFPSQNNEYLGRLQDPEADDPSANSLPWSVWKVKEMYERLIVGLGVPQAVMNRYMARGKRNTKALSHAHLKGVCDPTGMLPKNCVFITGAVQDSEGRRTIFGRLHKEVFVTRSPCVEPSDAKMLKVVGRKPAGMKQQEWNDLRSRPFGHIIFPTSEEDTFVPLSSLVGNGDLDGDDYFALWDEDIVKHVKQAPPRVRKYLSLQKCGGEKEKSAEAAAAVNRNAEISSVWLEAAQDTMLDLTRFSHCSILTGKLYGLCKSTADESSDGIFDEDACSLGRAYKDSVDIVKHGGKVSLPIHLHDKLPKSVKDCLYAESSDE